MSDIAEVVGIVRDVLLILVFLLAILILFVMWRKISSVLGSVSGTLRNVEEVADAVSSRFVKPAAAGSGIAFGIGKAAAFVRGMSGKKKRGGKGDG